MSEDTYRLPAPDEAPSFPRWPALRGLAVVGRALMRPAGWRVVWRVVAFVLCALLLWQAWALDRLRTLGGADPDRRDAARVLFADLTSPSTSGWSALAFAVGALTAIAQVFVLLFFILRGLGC